MKANTFAFILLLRLTHSVNEGGGMFIGGMNKGTLRRE